MAPDVSAGTSAFVALLCVALSLSLVAERVRLPAAVLLVAFGAIAGSIWHVHPPFAFGPTVLVVFLPPLIFEAAWHINLRSLRAQALRVAVIAVGGTVVTALAIACTISVEGELPFASALLLGAIVSATDPVAVIAVFRNVAVPDKVKTLVEAESLSNDGIAVVIYGMAMVQATGGGLTWLPALGHGAAEIVGGSVIGAVCAVPFWLMVKGTQAPEYEVTATIALAYVAYLAADHFGFSGIFATATAAFALRGLIHESAHMQNRDHVDAFWISAASIANATVFLATGLLIDIPRAIHEPLVVVAALAAMVVSRAAIALAAGRKRQTRITVFLAGMRGALPLALALALPNDLQFRPVIVDGVFAVVLVTLVFQGALLEPVVARLYGESRPT